MSTVDEMIQADADFAKAQAAVQAARTDLQEAHREKVAAEKAVDSAMEVAADAEAHLIATAGSM
jgi:hypothetical protein